MQFTSLFQSPAGWLLIKADDNVLKEVIFREDVDGVVEYANDITRQCADELKRYFEGTLKVFTVGVDPEGTAFQRKVWQELLKIPYAKTLSYHQMAENLGDVKSIRAAAHANGKNPIAIIVPCHRVIGSNGSLTGYAGGLWRKKLLLKLEGVLQKNQLELF